MKNKKENPLLYKSDGTIEVIKGWPKRASKRLKTAQKLVGGYAEILFKGEKYLFLGDEDGNLKDLPTNQHFTGFVGNVLRLRIHQFN